MGKIVKIGTSSGVVIDKPTLAVAHLACGEEIIMVPMDGSVLIVRASDIEGKSPVAVEQVCAALRQMSFASFLNPAANGGPAIVELAGGR